MLGASNRDIKHFQYSKRARRQSWNHLEFYRPLCSNSIMRKTILTLVFIGCAIAFWFLSSNDDSRKVSPSRTITSSSHLPPVNPTASGDPANFEIPTDLNNEAHHADKDEDLEPSETQRVDDAISAYNFHTAGIEASWSEFRVKIYAQLGLSPAQVGEVDQILSDYETSFDQLFQGLAHIPYDSDEYSQIRNQSERLMKEMDQDIEEYLGSKRFRYLKNVRRNFSEKFSRQFNQHLQISTW